MVTWGSRSDNYIACEARSGVPVEVGICRDDSLGNRDLQFCAEEPRKKCNGSLYFLKCSDILTTAAPTQAPLEERREQPQGDASTKVLTSHDAVGAAPTPEPVKEEVAQVAETPAPTPTTGFQCASEDGGRAYSCPECVMHSTCACNGLVKFGHGSIWTPWKKVSSWINCTVDSFGYDPYELHGKVCMCLPTSAEFQCASGSTAMGSVVGIPSRTCVCHGWVKFGYSTNWTDWKEVSGSIDCTAQAFQNDPDPEHEKICICQAAGVLGEAQQITAETRADTATVSVANAHTYTVCNGLTNQILGHAANIALAITNRKTVAIPDVYIVDGTQIARKGGSLLNVLPTLENSIPLTAVFDVEVLLKRIRSHGIQAALMPYSKSANTNLECNFLPELRSADSVVAREILTAMTPSVGIRSLLEKVHPAVMHHVSTLSVASSASPNGTGVCLHHRDGEDWHKHCASWQKQTGAQNCMSRRSMPDLVQQRISHANAKWIFYAGDHAVPQDLKKLDVPVVAREDAFPFSADFFQGIFPHKDMETLPRDLAAVIDYFICSSLPFFIGNSVSTWSASQIAQRNTMATWYNSGFIPLATFLKAYFIPIVYTYTEESAVTGKLMLKISIMSVREHMRNAAIHVLYHGSDDEEFQTWLVEHGVTLHDHRPSWRGKTERMRLAGHEISSHLYASAGNYFGTWQRIDIPLHISAEYCLLLDSDTIVTKRFTMDDFGMVITPTIGFSSELDEDDNAPSNAGVALMNIPFLRESLHKFHEFIFSHTTGDFKNGPSDQGAYLDFYGKYVTWLHTRFNFKPYYKSKSNWKNKFILHFHGLKPNDLIKYWFTGQCEPLKCYLIFRFRGVPYICPSMQEYARVAVTEGPSVVKRYCEETLPEYKLLCADFFKLLAGLKYRASSSCKKYVEAVVTNRGLSLSDYPGIGTMVER